MFKRVMLKQIMVLTSGLTFLWSSSAFSHTAWLVPVESGLKDSTQYQVNFGGHAGKLESYPAEKVKTIEAIGSNSDSLTVWRTMNDDHMQVRVDGKPAMLLMHFDNGIYTRTADGESVNMPMSQVKDPLSGVNAIKYHKTVSTWSTVVTTAQGQPFEVVPMSASAPKAGQLMNVKVLIDGKPAEGIEIGTGENTAESKTDAQGIVEFMPTKGFNKLWAGKRTEIANNPDYTELSIEYLLTFNAE
jgi:nickel transport protein